MMILETYLAASNGRGIGLFTKNKIPTGTIWWERNVIFDKIIPERDFEAYAKIQRDFIKTYGFLEATGNWYLCIDNARFCNHSDAPNSLNNFNAHGEILSCTAMKDILPNEEIFCDYRGTCLTAWDELGFESID